MFPLKLLTYLHVKIDNWVLYRNKWYFGFTNTEDFDTFKQIINKIKINFSIHLVCYQIGFFKYH